MTLERAVAKAIQDLRGMRANEDKSLDYEDCAYLAEIIEMLDAALQSRLDEDEDDE